MIKFTFENEDQAVKFWIDPVSGSLCVESQTEVIEIPHTYAIELCSIIRQKQAKFEEDNRKIWLQKWWG